MFLMFTDAYSSIKRFVQYGDWFNDVDMFNGKLRRNRVENLHAFWPGMEAVLGFSDAGARQLNTLFAVWADLGFLPEEFDNVQWQLGKPTMHAFYPLRPELIESTYHQYRTTGDRSWLAAGELFLSSLEDNTRTSCGFATVSDLTPEGYMLQDSMPSFFLSETCKYLYLLFDEHNYVHSRSYIFSTEAHLFDPMQLKRVVRVEELEEEASAYFDEINKRNSTAKTGDRSIFQSNTVRKPKYKSEADDQEVAHDETGGATAGVGFATAKGGLPLNLPSRCTKRQWWDGAASYVANFYVPAYEEEAATSILSEPGGMLDLLFRAATSGNLANAQKKLAKPQQPLSPPASASTSSQQQHAKATAGKSKQASLPTNSVGAERAAKILSISVRAAKMLKKTEENENGAAGGGRSGGGAGGGSSCCDLFGSDAAYINSLPYQHLKRREHEPDVFNVISHWSRRSDACYPEDEPPSTAIPGQAIASAKDSIKGRGTEGDAEWQRASGPLQEVKVSMGALGDFLVHVYSDGFVVHSVGWGDTLEISNVGLPVMFIRNYNSTSSKTIFGDMGGHIINCVVTVGEEGGGATTVWEKSCAVAAFGPGSIPRPISAELDLGEGLVVNAEIGAKKSDTLGETLCRPLPPLQPKSKVFQSTTNHWWPFSKLFSSIAASFGDDAGGHKNKAKTEVTAAPPPSDDAAPLVASRLAGKIAFAKRGECMFEDKALTAQREGALALIVSNNGDVLFTMSGRKHDDASQTYQTRPSAKAAASATAAKVEEKEEEDVELEEVEEEAQEEILESAPSSPRKPLPKSRRIEPHQQNYEVLLEKKRQKLQHKNALKQIKMELKEQKKREEKANNNHDKKKKPSAASPKKSEPSPKVSAAPRVDDDVVRIPTVMLTQTDSDELYALLRDRQARGGSTKVRVDVSATPMLLDSSLMGADDYPKLRMRRNLIHVLGQGQWGAVLNSNTGTEWQLFILAKSDMVSVHYSPAKALSPNKQPISTTAALTINPVELYARLLSRKCPWYIAVDESNTIKLRKEN